MKRKAKRISAPVQRFQREVITFFALIGDGCAQIGRARLERAIEDSPDTGQCSNGWATVKRSLSAGDFSPLLFGIFEALAPEGFEVPRHWFGFYGLPPALEETRMKRELMNRKRAQRRYAQDWRAEAIRKRDAGVPLNRIARRLGKSPAKVGVALAMHDELKERHAA